MRKKRASIELKCVDIEYFEPFMIKMCAQKVCEARVFFNRKDMRAFLKDETSERA